LPSHTPLTQWNEAVCMLACAKARESRHVNWGGALHTHTRAQSQIRSVAQDRAASKILGRQLGHLREVHLGETHVHVHGWKLRSEHLVTLYPEARARVVRRAENARRAGGRRHNGTPRSAAADAKQAHAGHAPGTLRRTERRGEVETCTYVVGTSSRQWQDGGQRAC
jgi:hypothetical protein